MGLCVLPCPLRETCSPSPGHIAYSNLRQQAPKLFPYLLWLTWRPSHQCGWKKSDCQLPLGATQPVLPAATPRPPGGCGGLLEPWRGCPAPILPPHSLPVCLWQELACTLASGSTALPYLAGSSWWGILALPSASAAIQTRRSKPPTWLHPWNLSVLTYEMRESVAQLAAQHIGGVPRGAETTVPCPAGASCACLASDSSVPWSPALGDGENGGLCSVCIQ